MQFLQITMLASQLYVQFGIAVYLFPTNFLWWLGSYFAEFVTRPDRRSFVLNLKSLQGLISVNQDKKQET